MALKIPNKTGNPSIWRWLRADRSSSWFRSNPAKTNVTIPELFTNCSQLSIRKDEN